jgi:hypothetical protein
MPDVWLTHRKKPRARRFSKRPIRGDLSASMSVAGTLYTLPLQQHNTPATLNYLVMVMGRNIPPGMDEDIRQPLCAWSTAWATTKQPVDPHNTAMRILSTCAGTLDPEPQLLLRPPYLFSTKLPSTALNSRYFVTSV